MLASVSSSKLEENLLSSHDHSEEILGTNRGSTSRSKMNASITISQFFSSPQFLAMLSNLSTSYNVVNIGLVLKMLTNLYPDQHSSESVSISASSLIAGMILGQLLGGTLGDVVGRTNALYCVMALQVVGSLGSAAIFVSDVTSNLNVFDVLAIWRFVLGLGAGGVYPLAAVLSAEQKHDDGHGGEGGGGAGALSGYAQARRWRLIAITFSTQGVGFLAVPVVAFVTVSVFGEESPWSWRIILGLGCVPGFFILIVKLKRTCCGGPPTTNGRYRVGDFDQVEEDHVDSAPANPYDEGATFEDDDMRTLSNLCRVAPVATSTITSERHPILAAMRAEPQLGRKLLGAAGTWFLFDILFYGNTLFQPVVINATFGNSSDTRSLSETIIDTLLLTLIALPGYFTAIVKLGHQSPRFIQSQGFIAMALLFASIGIFWNDLISNKNLRYLVLLLYGLTFFFSNYGPNTTTFMLPSTTFSNPHSRSTLNGVCAAAGKLGALLGAIFFVSVVNRWGERIVFSMCAFLSVVALILTRLFLEEGNLLKTEADDNSVEI